MTHLLSPETRPYVPRGSADYLRYSDYDPSPVHRNRLACMVDMVAAQGNDAPCRIAEIGCGTGNISVPLGSLGHQIDAMDIDPASLAIARKRNPFPNVHFHEPGAELDLENHEIVIMAEVLEHVQAYQEIFLRITQRMKRGAYLLLTVPNGWSPVEIACRPSYFLTRYAAGRQVVKAVKAAIDSRNLTTANEQTPHVCFFTLGALTSLFAETGMRVVQSHGFFFAWPVAEIFVPKFSSEKTAQSDFDLSQKLPLAGRAMWFFGLVKE